MFSLVSQVHCFFFVHFRKTTILTDEESSADSLQSIINTNFTGLVLCTKAAYKLIDKTQDYGHIVNINSILGHSVPSISSNEVMTNVYAGTKYAVTATTEVIRQELNFLKNKKVKVSVSTYFVLNFLLFIFL